MKIRKGFVSNSSSSSFIVISNSFSLSNKMNLDSCIVGDEGETQFGWDVFDYFDTESKINFVYLQILYTGNKFIRKARENMFESVMIEQYGCSDIQYTISFKNFESYIDHQSNAGCDKNIEMFRDKETLRSFLFDSESYIHTDNDNP